MNLTVYLATKKIELTTSHRHPTIGEMMTNCYVLRSHEPESTS